MRVLAIVCLLGSAALAQPAPMPQEKPAAKEPRVVLLEAGTLIMTRHGTLRLDSSQFMIPRDMVEYMVAIGSQAEALREENLECLRLVEKMDEPKPAWQTAMVWSGVTAAVLGAFVLGLSL